jgi:ABC-type multidrug transport system fused ATPase/permease subunit
MVAHILSIIKNVNIIIVLEAGRLVEYEYMRRSCIIG